MLTNFVWILVPHLRYNGANIWGKTPDTKCFFSSEMMTQLYVLLEQLMQHGATGKMQISASS